MHAANGWAAHSRAAHWTSTSSSALFAIAALVFSTPNVAVGTALALFAGWCDAPKSTINTHKAESVRARQHRRVQQQLMADAAAQITDRDGNLMLPKHSLGRVFVARR